MVSITEEETVARFGSPAIRRDLIDLLKYYFDEVHPLVDMATIAEEGVRPKCLENEICACFHHIARAFLASKTDEDALKEIEKAGKSHLKRLMLDSYKIIINSRLQEFKQIVRTLQFLVIVDDFKSFAPDGVAQAKEVIRESEAARDLYRRARHMEAQGDFTEAIKYFHDALMTCVKLHDAVQSFMSNGIYLTALAKAARDERKAQRDQRINWIFQVVTGVLSAVVAAIITSLLCR